MTDDVRQQTDDWEEVARRIWPLRRWFDRHPRLVDWIVILSCAGIQGLTMFLQGSPSHWTAYISLGATALALLWRRRYPFATLLLVVIVHSVGSVLLPELGYQNLAFTFALYTVASLQNTRRAVLGYLIGIIIPIAAVFVQAVGEEPSFSPAILDPLALISLAIGIAVRSQRQRSHAIAALVRERTERVRVTERARIAADMHDVVAHSLSVMIALANGASSAWAKHPDRSAAALRSLSKVGRAALTDMNRVLQLLPEDENAPTTRPAGARNSQQSVGELVEVFRTVGLPVRLTRRGAAPPDDSALHMTIYRIVQESLTNALRYAQGARSVEVVISTNPEEVDIQVIDNAPTIARPHVGTGQGLRGIAARADTYQGTSDAGPCPAAADVPMPSSAPMPQGSGSEMVEQRKLTRVLVVDDQPLVREGNSLLLDATDDIIVIGEASTGEEALDLVAVGRPDVVLMDVRMPGIGGVEATRRITQRHVNTKVIVLTTFDLDEYAFGGLNAGASAFILKSSAPEALIQAVRTVASGEAVVEPRITKRLIELYTRRIPNLPDADDALARDLSLLSPREHEVFYAMAQGRSNPEICDTLHLSQATVKSHINRIFAKMSFRDRAQAIIYAHRYGLESRIARDNLPTGQ